MMTDRYLPEVRSAAHLFHDMAKEFKSRGHEVAVITKFPKDYLEESKRADISPGWGEEDGISTLRVHGSWIEGHHPLLRGLDHVTLGFTFGRAARQWPGADVVLVYSPPLPLAAAGFKYGRMFNSPVVLNVQDIYPQTAIDLGLLRNRFAISIAERMERKAYETASRIVVHSPGNRAYLIERKNVPPEKIHVIFNWVNIDALRPEKRKNTFSQEHGLNDKFVISYAGLMGYAQDLSTVIDCAELMREEKDVVFLMVGEGVLEKKWKEMASAKSLENVRFLPLQSRDRYSLLLGASDICLVPLDGNLRTPVVPGKLQSIMAGGRPSITIVDSGSDAQKLAVESGSGFGVPPGEPAQLAVVIRRLTADFSMRENMGKSGRKFAEDNFSLSGCADFYEFIFDELMQTAGPDNS